MRRTVFVVYASNQYIQTPLLHYCVFIIALRYADVTIMRKNNYRNALWENSDKQHKQNGEFSR